MSTRRKSTILGLVGLAAAMAMLVAAAVGAASASASLPEFLPASGVSFTSTSGPGTLETLGGRKVECEADTDSGEITGPKEVGKVFVHFTKCTGPSGTTCTSPGATEEGLIMTKELMGNLVYLPGKKAGVLLLPTSGTQFAEFNCEVLGSGTKISVTGTLLGAITPINTPSTKSELIFKQSGGMQEYTETEAGTKDALTSTGTAIGLFGESFGPEESAEATTDEENTVGGVNVELMA